MNSKKTLIILVGILVVLIAGAAVLYNVLFDEVEREQLAVAGGESSQAESSQTESSQTESSQTDNSQTESSQASDAASQASSEAGEEQKDKAPDFTVYDLEGNAHKLSDFEGKPVVLNFWASWCGPCKSEMPDFEEVYKELGEEMHFVMVNATDGSQETIETASEFIEENGYTFPVYYDTDLEAVTNFGITAFPMTFMIDADGYLTAYARGAISKDILLEGIGMIR